MPIRIAGHSLRFCSWTPWGSRQHIQGSEHSGVYLLARFTGTAPARVERDDAAIVYIGETVARSLGKRWYEFNRSAFAALNGHSGGWSYRANVGRTPRGLYVAALPVPIDHPHRGAVIRHLERKFIWEFVSKHGRLPHCNSK